MFFKKWPPAAILDVQKSLLIAFLTISDRYHNFYFVKLFTKWPLAAILDVRKSLSIAFLAISYRYGTFFLLDYLTKWPPAEIHFRSHFWPFHIDTELLILFSCLTKWPPSAILDVRDTLSIVFLAISDRYATSFFGGHFADENIIFPKTCVSREYNYNEAFLTKSQEISQI